MANKDIPVTNKNEGEGSRSAALAHSAGVKKHIESGKVKPAAVEARKAIHSAENAELRDAEKNGEAKARH